jgi:hypothetical protein
MQKILPVAALMLLCVVGCQKSDADKVAKLPILNVNDLNDQHQNSWDALHAKYDGKEVIILGKANSDFNPDPGLFYQEGKYQYVSIQAGSGSAWVGVDCMLEKANADKFVGIKKDDVVTATGILHVNKGNMTLQPCTRDFRGSK